MRGVPDLASRTASRASRLAGMSRKRFLLSAGGMLGALSLAGTRADRAGATGVLGYYGTPSNTTGTYAPAGESHYLASDRPEVLSWGFLPNRDAEPVMTVRSGDLVTIEQISHEGILEDQKSPYEFFAGWGIPEADILDDQLMVFEEFAFRDGPGGEEVVGVSLIR